MRVRELRGAAEEAFETLQAAADAWPKLTCDVTGTLADMGALGAFKTETSNRTMHHSFIRYSFGKWSIYIQQALCTQPSMHLT